MKRTVWQIQEQHTDNNTKSVTQKWLFRKNINIHQVPHPSPHRHHTDYDDQVFDKVSVPTKRESRDLFIFFHFSTRDIQIDVGNDI